MTSNEIIDLAVAEAPSAGGGCCGGGGCGCSGGAAKSAPAVVSVRTAAPLSIPVLEAAIAEAGYTVVADPA